MLKLKKLIPIIAVVLIALGVNLEQFGIDLESLTGGNQSSQQRDQTNQQSNRQSTGSSSVASSAVGEGKKWSDTQPEINLPHIFDGEINRSGKPVGFHSRPGGQDPATARIKSIQSKPNSAGVYTATIEIRDGNQWKNKFSSFFPDSLSRQEVVEVILHAYHNSKSPQKQPWSGPSGMGFQVQGYTTSRGGINTAFPVYTNN